MSVYKNWQTWQDLREVAELERQTGREAKRLVFRVKKGNEIKTLGTLDYIENLIVSPLASELEYLIRELTLNKLYDFKNEGFIKNNLMLILKREFKNGY